MHWKDDSFWGVILKLMGNPDHTQFVNLCGSIMVCSLCHKTLHFQDETNEEISFLSSIVIQALATPPVAYKPA